MRRGRRIDTAIGVRAPRERCEERAATYRNAIRVLLTDALGLGLALLERVLVLELGAHVVGREVDRDVVEEEDLR